MLEKMTKIYYCNHATEIKLFHLERKEKLKFFQELNSCQELRAHFSGIIPDYGRLMKEMHLSLEEEVQMFEGLKASDYSKIS